MSVASAIKLEFCPDFHEFPARMKDISKSERKKFAPLYSGYANIIRSALKLIVVALSRRNAGVIIRSQIHMHWTSANSVSVNGY